MHDHSTKQIENIQINDVILNGNLNEVTVVHVIKHYLSSTELFQFYPNGPIFTKEHQFLSNMETQKIGVVSKDYLFAIEPQMEEFSNMVHELKDMEKVLQFKNGRISPESFQVARFDKGSIFSSQKIQFMFTIIKSVCNLGLDFLNRYFLVKTMTNLEISIN